MKDTPILFSAPMLRALRLAKRQTRREVPLGVRRALRAEQMRDDPREWSFEGTETRSLVKCPYGMAGDRLWVKETFYAFGRWETQFDPAKGRDAWHFVDLTLETGRDYRYAVDYAGNGSKRSLGPTAWFKRPAIFMPRHASRTDLEVTRVRVERLQHISAEDAIAEGLSAITKDGGRTVKYGIPDRDGLPGTDDAGWPWHGWRISPIDAYIALWEQINGAGAAAKNPLVWVVDFEVLA